MDLILFLEHIFFSGWFLDRFFSIWFINATSMVGFNTFPGAHCFLVGFLTDFLTTVFLDFVFFTAGLLILFPKKNPRGGFSITLFKFLINKI